MIAVVLIAAALHSVVAQGPLDTDVAAYDPGRTGVVSGRVYEERAKPNAPDRPVPTAVVWLVPRSETLLHRLNEIKEHGRDSMKAYRGAAARIRREREQYERVLWQAGGADLVFQAQADASGRFSFDHVPRGAWLVLGWRSVLFDAKTDRVPQRQWGTFALAPRLDRYQGITVWLTEITVDEATPVTIELTDRNVWFTGVLEEMKPGASR